MTKKGFKAPLNIPAACSGLQDTGTSDIKSTLKGSFVCLDKMNIRAVNINKNAHIN